MLCKHVVKTFAPPNVIVRQNLMIVVFVCNDYRQSFGYVLKQIYRIRKKRNGQIVFGVLVVNRLKTGIGRERYGNNVTQDGGFRADLQRSFQHVSVQIPIFVFAYLVKIRNVVFGCFHIGWISDNDVEAVVLFDDVVKFGAPVEGLMGNFPF